MKKAIAISLWAILIISVSGRRNRGLKYRDYQFVDKLTSYGKDSESDEEKTKPSISCLLFGEVGCGGACGVMCQLYGCTSNPVCRKMIYCECNEVYPFETRDVSADAFSTLSLEDLWYYRFQRSPFSTQLLNKIKNNPQMREFVLELLRYPHQTGEDIKRAILEQYPSMNELTQLQSIRHGEKESITNDGRLEYDNLGQYFGDLFRKLRDRSRNAAYRRRLMRILRNISSKEELEYILRQILMSGNESLFHFVNSYLRNRGIDFDEDSGEFMGRMRNKRRRRRPRHKRCKRKRGRFYDSSSSQSDSEQEYYSPGRGETIKKIIKLKNGRKTVEMEVDENDVVELAVTTQLMNSADKGIGSSQYLNTDTNIARPDSKFQDKLPITPISSNSQSQLSSTSDSNYLLDFPDITKANDFQSSVQELQTSSTDNVLKGTPAVPHSAELHSDQWEVLEEKLPSTSTLNSQVQFPSTPKSEYLSDFSTIQKVNYDQSNKPKMPNSLLENFPKANIHAMPQPGLQNGPFSRPMLGGGLRNGNLGGRFPGASNFGDSIGKTIEEKINQQKQQMEEMKEKAANSDDDGKTHTTFTSNSVSNSVVANEVNGKKTEFAESTVEKVNKDSKRPEANIDETFKMNAVSVKDNLKDVDGTVIQTVTQDNLKGVSEMKSASNGYYITEGSDGSSSSNSKSTTFSAPGVNSVYQMVQENSDLGANLQHNQYEGEDDHENSVHYVILDEDGNIVQKLDELGPEHLPLLEHENVASGSIVNAIEN